MKANELISKDLMIGDWLQDSFGNIGQVYRIDPGRVHLRLLQERPQDEEHIVHDIEPIPLTPEILKKNGFRVNPSDSEKMFFQQNNYRWCYYLNSINRFSGINITEGTIVQKIIVNVHELQHALRLCGINKEIVV